ncbi:hypothetical protein B0H11DRAFT_260750 [Mycena galericulata]|nr:hypothetical protein B0H11DRAFT_260750 [Mycena galericulata]
MHSTVESTRTLQSKLHRSPGERRRPPGGAELSTHIMRIIVPIPSIAATAQPLLPTTNCFQFAVGNTKRQHKRKASIELVSEQGKRTNVKLRSSTGSTSDPSTTTPGTLRLPSSEARRSGHAWLSPSRDVHRVHGAGAFFPHGGIHNCERVCWRVRWCQVVDGAGLVPD